MDFTAFLIKKIVSRLIYPLGTALAALVIALITLKRGRTKISARLLLAATIFLFMFSMPITGQVLLAPLEKWAGDPINPKDLKREKIRYIVVLGGGIEEGAAVGQLQAGSATLFRFMEAFRLYRQIPKAGLILSGGTPNREEVGCAKAMADLAERLGIPDSDYILESDSWDTGDQAKRLRTIMGIERFALVTSASHMPRSMAVFRANGLDPIPAPAHFITRRVAITYRSFLPGAGGLGLSEQAIHEYAGLVWLKLKLLTKW
jgi:uncharacterized SAM-binding protein YcdF (DUF218 family)